MRVSIRPNPRLVMSGAPAGIPKRDSCRVGKGVFQAKISGRLPPVPTLVSALDFSKFPLVYGVSRPLPAGQACDRKKQGSGGMRNPPKILVDRGGRFRLECVRLVEKNLL